MRDPITIRPVYVGENNVPKEVASDIQSRIQADFAHFAPPVPECRWWADTRALARRRSIARCPVR
jgi:hypothetical protein